LTQNRLAPGMRIRTALALAGVAVVLVGLAVGAIAVPDGGGELTERWVSDTPRDNRVNHHAVGVGPDDEVVVAPIAEVPNADTPVTDTSCSLVRLAPEDGSVAWRDGVPADACFTHALTQPAIADIDGDGTFEVAVSSTEGALTVRDARDGSKEFRVPLATYGYGRPTIADITPDPGREVVTSDIKGNVVVATADGRVAWRVALNRTFADRVSVWETPRVADVDGDGAVEILVGTNRGLAVLSGNGTVEWTTDAGASYVAISDGDGTPSRRLLVSHSGVVRAIDGATADEQWSREVRGTARIRTTGDADGDGTVELYVGRHDGKLLALDASTGGTEWSTTVTTDDDATLPPPVLGDVNGDGAPEVVAVANDGTVAVLDANTGAELAAYERTVPVWTFATPTDIDDDGREEVLVRYGDGRVVALDLD